MEVISNGEASKLTFLDQAAIRYARKMTLKSPIWSCRHCQYTKGNKSKVLLHLKEKYEFCCCLVSFSVFTSIYRHDIDPAREDDLFPDPTQVFCDNSVILVSDEYRDEVESLPRSVQEALEDERAVHESDL